MKLYLKYDIHEACKKILHEQLTKLQLTYTLTGFGEVEMKDLISVEQLKQLNSELKNYGIEIVESQKNIMVQKIKDAIIEMVYLEEELPVSKISSYLAGKLNQSYGHLYNLFSEITFTSIEYFIILQKIERAKQLLVAGELTVTEVSYKLNYSSVAHFSTQFKNTTGLTPSTFLRIIEKKRNTSKVE
jgi:AraC-like DNA-binding protein